MLQPEQFNYLSTYLLAHEAEKRGIEVKKIFTTGTLAKDSMLELKYKKHEEIIIGQTSSLTDSIGLEISKNKELAKYFFRKAGLQTAEGETFHFKNVDSILECCRKIGFPVVLKPLDGTHGTNVFLNVASEEKVEELLKKHFVERVMVEKQYPGEEYRLFATKEKFLAGIRRIPANVQGDGIHTIQELIEVKNQDPRRGTGDTKALCKIPIDDIVKDFLKEQGKHLACIPIKGEIVYLRGNSNISTGGDYIDITDIIHPEIQEIAVKVINAIPGLAYGGVDYLTKGDITRAPSSDNYIIIEVNYSPALSIHHIPYQGKERDIAKEIINMIFPETKDIY